MSYRPRALLAELTYRCPLHCPYCSNPVQQTAARELKTSEWIRVIEEAAALGVLHAGFSGGEPLARSDLGELVSGARASGLYTNLLTSGVGLDGGRLAGLKQAGLDSIQLSLQAADAALADRIAGAPVHLRKLEVATRIRKEGIALSLNVVLHRENIGQLPEIIALAESLGAQRLELANTQYYGWAAANRFHLFPSRGQVLAARNIAIEAQRRLAGRMEVFYVLPDYFENRPKPCMQGWGRTYITINPFGAALPCPSAFSIAGLRFDNVTDKPLAWIWEKSESFNRFRGTEWMPEPCQSCPEREIDFGGCRCQAAALTGDAAQPDPVCSLSAGRRVIDEILRQSESASPPALRPRQNPAIATCRN